jgi:CDP-paratose 2-epimerase
MAQLSGQAFNIGGGPAQTLSLLELLEHIVAQEGTHPDVRFGNWRSGDQKYYVSDITRFHEATGWTPKVSVRAGVGALGSWLRVAQSAIEAHAVMPAAAR